MRRWGAAILLLYAFSALSADRITYEIYSLDDRSGRALLAKGVKTYDVTEIVVDEHRLSGTQHWSKALEVANGFYLGGSIYRQPELVGFGLWIRRPGRWYEIWKDGGFSWEWFSSRQPDNVYRKLQGAGRVKVTLVPSVKYEEIAAVEFLDDVTMRLNDRPWFFFSDEKTHHVVIGKGSVLRFAP